MTEVMLWVQTTQPATVQYQYWDENNPTIKMKSVPVKTLDAYSHIAKTVISGLKPGTKFGYEVLINGKTVKRDYPLRFQTQALWQWRTDPPEFTVGFGSCAYINEPEFDRPGRSYGASYEIFQVIAGKKPDLFIWGGDNMYLREPDWDSRSGIIHRHTHTRSIPEMQPLLGAVHNYALWDDHDFGPNDADRTYRLREESLDIFKMFWANQTYGTAETKGIFGRFVWNDVEFFLLDNRYHRSPNRAPNDGAKTMFGKEQLQWIKDALINSKANTSINFRIVVSGNQFTNTNSEYSESFTQFSAEYAEFMKYIKDNSIPGILFLSGDRHLTELIVVRDSSLYPLYDFTSSALTSGLNGLRYRNGELSKEFANPLRVEGTLVNDKHNFGILKFTGERNKRVVSLEVYDLTGTRRWVKTISADELQVQP